MFFRQIIHEEKSCLSYMVGCPNQGVCATVDAQGDPQQYIDIADSNGLKISAVIETHIQADHASSSQRLAEITGTDIYFGPKATVNFNFKELADGDVIQIGRRQIKAIHTPGHTSEHICLLVDDWLVLTGDTLFVGDVGRVDLVDAKDELSSIENKASQLYASVHKLLKLPDVTEIYPGHYRGSACGKGMDSKPSSTIGREKLKNDVLKMSQSDFIQYLLRDMPPPPSDFKQIKKCNSGLKV